jgi:hypothetical protein
VRRRGPDFPLSVASVWVGVRATRTSTASVMYRYAVVVPMPKPAASWAAGAEIFADDERHFAEGLELVFAGIAARYRIG